MEFKHAYILLLLISLKLEAQKEDYTWIAGINPVKMDFSDTGFTFDTSFSAPNNYPFFNTSFTENDSAGNLLFYTDGATVYDRYGSVMENGTGLNPSAYLTELGGGNGFLQAAMGVKKPGSDSLYYLFHFGVSDTCPGSIVGAGYICRLFLSVIDIRANSGLGAVIEKNHVLMQDSLLTGTEMTLIKHGNGRDWWLIKHGDNSINRYYKFLITPSSITGPFTQDIGSFPNIYSGEFGTATISPNGTIFAGVTGGQNINIFDFDRCTGMFSSPDTFAIIDSTVEDTISVGTSLAFSPNGRFLYVNYLFFINQYDLYAPNIETSKYTLITLSESSPVDSQFLQMQLAPDGKIYIGPYDGRPFISVINQPDSPGMSCHFAPCNIYIPCSLTNCDFVAIPMFPQYRLPTMPIYLADAGADKETCKDTLVQLGIATMVPQLMYTWMSSDPNAIINNMHGNQTLASTQLDSAQFYLLVVDTVSQHSCLERIDTVTVRTNLCTTGIMQTTNPIKIKYFPYLYVYDILPQTQLTVCDLLGQPVYTSTNYENNWDVRTVANAVYVFQLTSPDGQKYNGKVVVVH